MRNLAAKVPTDLRPDTTARATAACQAPSRAIARGLAAGLVVDVEAQLPTATRRFSSRRRRRLTPPLFKKFSASTGEVGRRRLWSDAEKLRGSWPRAWPVGDWSRRQRSAPTALMIKSRAGFRSAQGVGRRAQGARGLLISQAHRSEF
jgi:hypothetical protein